MTFNELHGLFATFSTILMIDYGLGGYIYNAVLSEHINVRKIKTKIIKLPWITSEIRKAMNKGIKLLKKSKDTKDKTVWKEYKREKNRIRTMLRNEELKYWKNRFAQAKNSYEFWKIVREIQGKSSNKSTSILNPIHTGGGGGGGVFSTSRPVTCSELQNETSHHLKTW